MGVVDVIEIRASGWTGAPVIEYLDLSTVQLKIDLDLSTVQLNQGK